MFTEDLAPFFADFGADATLSGQAVRGIFSDPHAVGAVGSIGMADSQPDFTLATADVPANPVGALLVASGVTYTVVAHEPDGTGVSRLLLEPTA